MVEHLIGSFAFDENGKLINYVLNPKDIGKAVDILINLDQGVPPQSTLDLLSSLKPDEVVVENDKEIPTLQKLGYKISYVPHHIGAKEFRQNLVKYALDSKFISDSKELYDFMYQVSMEYTRRKIRGAAQKRDLLAIQTIRAIDDIDKTINLFSERLREWYSLHFPELDELLEDHEAYAKIVSTIGLRNNVSEDMLKEAGITGNLAKRIYDASKKSIGADIMDVDLKSIRLLSDTILHLYEIRRQLTDYLDSVMKEVAPNITALVGATLGARLLSLAGSLEELSKMPASTIQVLGAEKALFRALRTGSRPPKHGVIFQYPAIHSAPRWQRGKIARALAAKLAIASRVDAFSGRFIGDQLDEQLKKRTDEIKTKYAQPPPRKPQAAPVQKEKGGGKRRRGGKHNSQRGGKSKNE